MKLWSKFRALFRRRKLDTEMAEEMRLHLELQTKRNVAAGMNPDEARYAARRTFGGIEQIKEQCRDQRSWMWLEQTLRDVRFAGRMLRKNRGFAVAAIMSLALCIGANTAVFSMLYALVIRPLPFHGSERIVEIYNSLPKVGMPKLASNFGQYFDFKENAPAFEHLGLWQLNDYTFGEENGPMRISGALATAELFEVIEVHPLIGRFFTADNHVPAANGVVVLTESFWRSQFQGDRDVIGRTLLLDGETFEIIGVAPRILEALDARVRLIRPLSWSPIQQFGRIGYSARLFGRMKATTTLVEAHGQVSALEQKYYDTAPIAARDLYDRTGHLIHVDTVQSQRATPVKASLYLLQGGALFVLLIGGVNVANLLLARCNARRAEFSMRAALGASRGAIVRQLWVESAMLTGVGAACGLVLAWVGLGAANHFTANLLPDALPFSLDPRVLGYVAAITAILTLVIGVLPVAQLLGGNLGNFMQSGGRAASSGREVRTMSGALIVVQVAFALVLLIGAGLLIRSFTQVLAIESGFDPQHVIGARVGVPKDKEKSFSPRLFAALHEIPGIEVSMGSAMPFRHVDSAGMSMPLGVLHVKDHTSPPDAGQPSVYYSGVLPSYFSVMRIPLLEGRWFDNSDMEHNRSIIVDEAFARRYFPGRSPVGQHLMLNKGLPQKEEDWQQIIGVVGNVRANGVEDKSGQPFLYVPLTQTPFHGTLSIFIRTARPVSEVAALLREKVTAVDPTLPIVQIALMESVIDESLSNRRGIMWLLASFAGVALILSAVGIHGVLAYDVSQRTCEIGIRSALGATRGQLAGMVVRQGLWKTSLGTAAGLAGAAILSRFMASLLFEVSPIDPLVYVLMALLLGLVAAVACWLPARRATKVDPMVALRCE
jgi:predicted permease